MNRSISKSLVVKTSASVQPVKVLLIGLPTEEVQIADFKVGEELAIIVVSTVVRIEQPVEVSIRMDELWMSVDEGAGTRPEGGKRTSVVEDVHVETVFHVVVAREAEDVVVDVAEKVDLPRTSSALLRHRHFDISHTSGSTRQYQSKSLSRGCL